MKSGRGFKSITSRLIAATLLACGGAFVATIVVSNAVARRLAFETAQREALGRADAVARRVESLLDSVEERTRFLADVLPRLEAAETAPLLRRIAERPALHGIAWVPVAGEAVYASRRTPEAGPLPEAGRVRLWHAELRHAGGTAWSEPQPDDAGNWFVAYATPAGDGTHARAGTVVVELSLDWLDEAAASLVGEGSGVAVILSRSGRLLAYPHREAAGAYRPLLEELPPERRAQLAPVVERMLAGEQGFVPIEVQGRPGRLAFQPVGGAGWSLGVVYPEDEVLGGVHRLRLIQAALAVAGLALLAGVVVLVSRRITRPVKALAAGAGRIATGDLDAELPPAESRDELGGLANAFRDMRDSLKTHIRELGEATAARERHQSEMKIARRIQADMLPEPRAGRPGDGYELAATLVPARAVGGDLFDHFRAGDRVFVLVGDVSGKGVGAALFMARARTLFETVAARESDPAAILAELNRGLSAGNEAGMYLTAVLCALHVASGELDVALAGHEPPMLLPAEGAAGPLTVEGGPAMGLLDAAAYPLSRLRLAPGQAVVLYTDGVSDARNLADELFESQRLAAALRPLADRPAGDVTDGLLAAVRAHAGDAPQFDDITILTLRYLARS